MELGDCVPDGPDHFGPVGNGKTSKPWNGAASRFSDSQYKMASAACDPGDKPPKTACFLPHHEPSGTVNVNGVHAAAQRVSSLSGHSAQAVAAAKAHLRSHYKQLGEDPPDSIGASTEGETMADENDNDIPEWVSRGFGAHAAFDGNHAHAHSPYGQQGDDETHDHSHSHDGDSVHRHTHGATIEPVAAASLSEKLARMNPLNGFTRVATDDEISEWCGLLDFDELTASADPMLGSTWAIYGDERGFFVIHRATGDLTASAVPWTSDPLETYGEALAVISEQLAQSGDTRPVLPQGWQSEMAYEGVSTGDGRFIDPGAIQYRATPMPLMLQTTTEPGHMGAVLAGAINKAATVGQVAFGMGDFDSTDAGKQFNQIIDARGKFGVSIDVAEAEGDPVCVTHGGVDPRADDSQCDYDCDIEMHFSLIKIMGVTGTPFPAFADAYITKADTADDTTAPAALPVAADGAPPCENCEPAVITAATNTLANLVVSTAGGNGGSATYVDPLTSGGSGSAATIFGPGGATLGAMVSAAYAATARPPKEWFENPQFSVDDGRMVRQPNGKFACPLTVDEPDPETGLRRVYGHMAGWFSCHTGVMGRCVTPPPSKTDYAAFHLGGVMTSAGVIRAGHLSMGCGHANTTGRERIEDVRAHYDGGPGAVRAATVRAGEDAYGIWFAGYVPPEVTDAQIEAFAACSVSGDWREVWRGNGLDLVACLAGVTSPGFPIASALAAAGLPVTLTAEIGDEATLTYIGANPVALVAAGVIRQPFPWERTQAEQTRQIADLTGRLRLAEAVTGELAPLAAERLLADSGVFSAPTDVDKAMPALLSALLRAAHAASTKQATDPDSASDPVDKKIAAALQAILTDAADAIRLQGEDGAPDDGPPQPDSGS